MPYFMRCGPAMRAALAKVVSEDAECPIVADHPLELRWLWRSCSVSVGVVAIVHHPDIEVSIDVPWIKSASSCFFHEVALVLPIGAPGFRARYSCRRPAIGVANREGELQSGVSGDAAEGRGSLIGIVVMPAIVFIEHTQLAVDVRVRNVLVPLVVDDVNDHRNADHRGSQPGPTVARDPALGLFLDPAGE